ncbi:MAG: aminotransferase class I/II-fold pyridoxal phosphate-dependent enzyme [Armatimonadota bacterium]
MDPREATLSVADKSPFLLRDLLLAHAAESERDDLKLLDASRGAANWQLRRVLNAWHALGMYAAWVPETPPDDGEVALALDPDAPHADSFAAFADLISDEPLREGCELLQATWDWLAGEVLPDRPRDRIIYEFAEAAAGRAYASPPTLDFVQPILTRYLAPLLFDGDEELAAQFDVIGCEGATTGIAMAAATLARNRIVQPGDRVAMWWPTYEPLRDLVECQLGCEVVPIHRDPDTGWAAIPEELEKLDDPAIRLAIIVSPGNPVPVTTDPGSLDALERAVERNPDLLIIADYVYMHFLDEPVETEIGRLPLNTIGVYSVSKDFGLAGMRLGTVLMHPEGAGQRALTGLAGEARSCADDRYCRRALEACDLELAERIIADSRGVSFTHMSGISTSLQALICLCAAYDLIDDESERYFAWVRGVLADRVEGLFAGLGLPRPAWADGPSSRYATIVDLVEVARARGGVELAGALESRDLWQFMTYLAREWKVILTPGEAFGAGEWSVRACFPSVNAEQARELGERVAEAVEAYARGG